MTSSARRRLGQHFLESAWVDKLLTKLDPAREDTFLEIGPGRGALTLPLAERCAHVTAVEIDPVLALALRSRAPDTVSVVTADVLALDFARLELCSPARAVGNLPYNVATQILLKLLGYSAHGSRLSDAMIMLQREVADRVTGVPGTRAWGPLAVATRLSAMPTRVMTLPPGAFRPMPTVQSAVVRLEFRPAPVSIGDRPLFDALVRELFTQRRKTALNALRPFARRRSHLPASEVFARARVDASHRPGELDLSELAELSAVLASAPL